MQSDAVYRRYQDLQRYVGWTADDARRVRDLADLLRPSFTMLIDDFYQEIERHPHARKVITGGAEQILRLKTTLLGWLDELFCGCYDADYVARRWKVGLRHVEIGLDQVYTNAALSRLRAGLLRAHEESCRGDLQPAMVARRSLNSLLDLDLAIIEDAYQTEFHARQQRSERLATIGQIAGGVAHELRNPLNVMKTSVYYLLHTKNPAPEKVIAHLSRIERQVNLADDVITALNNFGRLPLPEFLPVDLELLLKEVVELNSLPPEIQVHFLSEPAVPKVLGDGKQLKIVFGNLIRNAREAMPEGGELRLVLRRLDMKVEASVIDTGVGIAREHLPHLAEPLYSTKSRGIGLGLAITRAILEKHGGSWSVSSEPGCGATFLVSLIAYEPPDGQGIKTA